MENATSAPSNRIEYANRGGKFTEAEVRGFVAETKRRQAQPGYAEAQERETRSAQTAAKGRGIKFPDLACRRGTRPAVASAPATPARNGWKKMFEILQ